MDETAEGPESSQEYSKKRRSNRDSRSCIITKLSYCEIVVKCENEKCFLVEKKKQKKTIVITTGNVVSVIVASAGT